MAKYYSRFSELSHSGISGTDELSIVALEAKYWQGVCENPNTL